MFPAMPNQRYLPASTINGCLEGCFAGRGLRRRVKKISARTMRIRPATPPTTAPAMAPPETEEEFEGDALVVLLEDNEVAVEEVKEVEEDVVVDVTFCEG